MQPRHRDADGHGSQRPSQDVGGEVRTGEDPLDGNAAADGAREYPGPDLLAISQPHRGRGGRERRKHRRDMAAVEGQIALGRREIRRIVGVGPRPRPRHREVRHLLNRGVHGERLGEDHEVFPEGFAQADVEKIDDRRPSDGDGHRHVARDVRAAIVARHRAAIDEVESRGIAGTADSRQLVFQERPREGGEAACHGDWNIHREIQLVDLPRWGRIPQREIGRRRPRFLAIDVCAQKQRRGEDDRDAHGAGRVIVSESSVIWPVVQSSLPSTADAVPTEFDDCARMVPLKLTPPPRVDEEPIAQNTLAAFAPLTRKTLAPLLTVSADPSWKIQTALESPWPSRTRVPFTAIIIVDPEV